MVKRVLIESQSLEVSRAIMIIWEQTSSGREELSDSMITVETFKLEDLQVNITHHDVVPKHSVLSDEQKNDLLNKYRI